MAQGPKVDSEWLKEFTYKFILKEVPSDSILKYDFKLKSLEGQEVSLSDFKGKVIFLNFFATWCPPCVQELPEFEHFYQELGKTNFIVVAINNKETRPRVAKFVKNHKLTFPVLLDEEGLALMGMNIQSMPTSFIFDKSGKLRYRIDGIRKWEDKDFLTFFKYLAEEKI